MKQMRVAADDGAREATPNLTIWLQIERIRLPNTILM